MKRAADPYRDLDVIDSRAPRTNQAVVGVLALVACVTGWWGILAGLAIQLAVGLRFGRKFCLPCLAYFELLQPAFGEGPVEDARPPRFANLVATVVLGAASVAHATGRHTVGLVLGTIVTALALVAASTGLCVGCEAYRIGARLRGVRSKRLARIDTGDLGVRNGREVVVEFTHPLCSGCHTLAERLVAEGREVVAIDVAARPDLARKYGVAVVPTAVAVNADGAVTARLAG